jgi:hypothetical protein
MRAILFGVVLAVVTGCGDDEPKTTDSGTPPDSLAIVGTWLDEFDTEHVIDEEAWTQQYAGYDPLVFEIAAWGDGWLVAQNGAQNAYFAGAWSRFDWAWDGELLLVCQSAFDAPDQAAAEAATPADTRDLDAGCGGFPFSTLTPAG